MQAIKLVAYLVAGTYALRPKLIVEDFMMPLVPCPICEKPISKRAHTCPECGEPDPLNHVAKSTFVSTVLWSLAIVAAGYVAWVYLLPMLVESIRYTSV